MRSPVALFLLILGVLTGLLPCHRCTPTGCDGPGATVLLGSHAHGDHGEEEDEGEPCCPGHDHPRAPQDEDNAPCCVDSAADPTAPPVRTHAVPLPVDATAAWLVVEATRVASTVAPTWEAPVPRAPTETVVLLR